MHWFHLNNRWPIIQLISNNSGRLPNSWRIWTARSPGCCHINSLFRTLLTVDGTFSNKHFVSITVTFPVPRHLPANNICALSLSWICRPFAISTIKTSLCSQTKHWYSTSENSTEMAEARFECGYAKLGTSTCKKCKQKIEKGTLRIAKVMTEWQHICDLYCMLK